MATRKFAVQGPFPIPTYGSRGSKSVDVEKLDNFWDKTVKKWGSERGCYVFALRMSRGAYLPVYVGKTGRRTFREECLTSDKLIKAGRGMRNRTGNLVLFLLIYRASRGAINQKVIQGVEDFLIKIAKETNPNLVNKQRTKVHDFAIEGVYKSSPGKPSVAARSFAKMLGFQPTGRSN